MTRIFVAGFQHETNTFAPSKADWAAFEADYGYPAFSRGAAMLQRLSGSSLPMGGFIRAAQPLGWTLLPSVWAGASPSAHITEDAFERIVAALLADVQHHLAHGGFDGIYLDLHGAAVAEHADDAEGELLQRLRAVVGSEVPLVASLDLHANVTARMLEHTDAMTAFREYPHVDMPETGARALGLLKRLMAGERLARHARRLPFLLPLNAQCTWLEPAATVMKHMAELEQLHGASLSFAMGFPAADFAECGPVVFGVGSDEARLASAVAALHADVIARGREWSLDLHAPDEAVQKALALSVGAERPVVIADTQDNPGAGGDANTTGLLHALLRQAAGRQWPGQVALGLLYDPASARAACEAGVGARLALSLGRSVVAFDGRATDPPVQLEAEVRAVSDGRIALHGPMSAGNHVDLGPCARVDVGGIQVLLASGKSQMLDLGLYRFLGIEPSAMKLLVNKSSVHFRAAFAPIASHILVAKAPGPMAADPQDLPWRHLPAGLARSPAAFAPAPADGPEPA